MHGLLPVQRRRPIGSRRRHVAGRVVRIGYETELSVASKIRAGR
jgi:hypothetical protein